MRRWWPAVCLLLLSIGSARAAEHPRLSFRLADVPKLRAQAKTTHKAIADAVIGFADAELGTPVPRRKADAATFEISGVGGRLEAFALAYVLTGERKYFDLTRRWMDEAASWPSWQDDAEGHRDLGMSHLMIGFSSAYDWLYRDLAAADRARYRAVLAARAQEMYETSTGQYTLNWSHWWRRSYLQNHDWVNHTSLGTVALALRGEDPRASRWLEQAVGNLQRDIGVTRGIRDGTWHEGLAYQSYMLGTVLPFLVSLRANTGLDLIPHEYLRNHVLWRAYNYLPDTYHYLMTFADFTWDWGSPSLGRPEILRLLAREYRDGHAEWLAERAPEQQGLAHDTWNIHMSVDHFLAYDPSVAPVAPTDLPLARTFPDLEGVIWRTGWGPDDLVFGLKTGPFGGRYAYDTFATHRYPWGQEGEEFNPGHDHADANTFSLTRGKTVLASETLGYNLTDTRLHNTLLVDRTGQYKDADHNPAPQTDGKLEVVYDTPHFDFLLADATRPYSAAGLDVTEFRRSVLFVRPGYFVLVDNVRAASAHQFDWACHFPQPPVVEGEWLKAPAEGGQVLGVRVLAPQPFASYAGGDDTPNLRLHPASNTDATRFVLVLFPTTEGQWEARPRTAFLGDTGHVVGVRVLLDGTQDTLVRYGHEGTPAPGGYVFDGRVASVARDAAGDLQRIFLGGGRRLFDQEGRRPLVTGGAGMVVEVDYVRDALTVQGQHLEHLTVLAPGVDAAKVMVNGRHVLAERHGPYLVLP